MVSATLFFAVMDGVSRYLAEAYNVMVINMLRAWVLALIVILISMRKGKGIKKVSTSELFFANNPWNNFDNLCMYWCLLVYNFRTCYITLHNLMLSIGCDYFVWAIFKRKSWLEKMVSCFYWVYWSYCHNQSTVI